MITFIQNNAFCEQNTANQSHVFSLLHFALRSAGLHRLRRNESDCDPDALLVRSPNEARTAALHFLSIELSYLLLDRADHVGVGVVAGNLGQIGDKAGDQRGSN